jgi:hypothetical protein
MRRRLLTRSGRGLLANLRGQLPRKRRTEVMLHQIISATATNAPISKPLLELVDVLLWIGMVLCVLAFIAVLALKAVGNDGVMSQDGGR